VSSLNTGDTREQVGGSKPAMFSPPPPRPRPIRNHAQPAAMRRRPGGVLVRAPWRAVFWSIPCRQLLAAGLESAPFRPSQQRLGVPGPPRGVAHTKHLAAGLETRFCISLPRLAGRRARSTTAGRGLVASPPVYHIAETAGVDQRPSRQALVVIAANQGVEGGGRPRCAAIAAPAARPDGASTPPVAYQLGRCRSRLIPPA